MNNTEVLDTITTTDQNTGAQITWNIVHSAQVGPNVAKLGWTHHLTLVRPKGRKAYGMSVTIIGDVVVRNSAPIVASW